MTAARFLIAALLITMTAAAQAGKTDVIVMVNGDRVTGKILDLRQGQLRVDTVSMGTVTIKWPDVDRLESTKVIQAETANGRRYLGQVPHSSNRRTLTIESSTGRHELLHNDVVRLDTINANQSFFENLNNMLSIGFTYTQASDVLQWNIAASSEYRTPKFLARLEFDSMITDNRASRNLTRRGDISANYYRFRPNRFFWYGSASVQANDELGIDRRVIASGGLGRNVWQTSSSELVAAIGVAGNVESSIGTAFGPSRDDTNIEAMFQADWSFFKLHAPTISANLKLQYYAGITDSSRQRSNINLKTQQEFVRNLFWALTVYSSFDNKPPSGAVARQDFGVVTSLEYKF